MEALHASACVLNAVNGIQIFKIKTQISNNSVRITKAQFKKPKWNINRKSVLRDQI